ncbi:hypothetical protein [uncultured Tateyamaria sp.]|uniref:hypothetical protein n=1 Tax=uncultured Tateyamaria sp. TaxID=455651 RepID=UPI0026303E73|nr:hypothetical protein [uncultured Tateyamaria sp.]
MSNGSNDFDVTFSQIVWIEKVLRNHKNTLELQRTNDIQFDLERLTGGVCQLICINEYTCGVGHVLEVLDTFPNANIIYIGGNWNGYTLEAKEYCLEAKLGLYNSSEINGALYRTDFWNYHRKDKKGNPSYQLKAAE